MNVQANPKSPSLAELARKAPKYDQEFTDTLRSEGKRDLQAAEDLLVINHAADVKEGMQVVDGLKDLRSSLMIVHDRVVADSGGNLKKAQEYADGLKVKEGELKGEYSKVMGDEEHGYKGYDKITRHYFDEEASVVAGQSEPKGLGGLGAYIRDLTKVISVATAAAALPPGPMAVSVGTFAREDAESEGYSRVSGHFSGGSQRLFSESRIQGSLSGEASQSSSYSKISTDERMLAMIDDLNLRLDQMGTHEETTLEVHGTQHYTTRGFKDRRIFKDKDHLLHDSRNAYLGRGDQRLIATMPHQVPHPDIPESAMDRYS